MPNQPTHASINDLLLLHQKVILKTEDTREVGKKERHLTSSVLKNASPKYSWQERKYSCQDICCKRNTQKKTSKRQPGRNGGYINGMKYGELMANRRESCET